MTSVTHPEVSEDYSAMKKTLKKNPTMLLAMLTSRKKDLGTEMQKAMVALDTDAVNTLSAEMVSVDQSIARVHARLMAETDSPEENESNEPIEQKAPVPKVRPPAPAAIGLGFRRPEPEPLEDEERALNPVSMNARLRRDMGTGAADFLDDYASEIRERTVAFFNEIKTKALELGDQLKMGEEDPNDGQVSLREMLLTEVGRRGLQSIEPVFEEWRSGVMKVISKELRDMFTPPETVVELKDEEIGSLLGLDSMDAEQDEADEAESADEADAQEVVEEEEEEEEESEDEEEEPAAPAPAAPVEAGLDAPIQIARGRISSADRGPGEELTASLTSVAPRRMATDFLPSGKKPSRLE